MSVAVFDIDPESRRVLEFDELLDWIADSCRTAPGAERARALAPETDPRRIEDRLQAVEELREILEEQGAVIPGGLPDPTGALERLAVRGMPLEALALRGLAIVLTTGAELRSRLSSLEPERFPYLQQLGTRIPDLRGEVREVLEYVEPDGRIADGASLELARIRADRVAVGDRLQRMLE